MDIILTSIKEVLTNLDEYINIFLTGLGFWGAILSCFCITIESILPVLPLCVFITLVFYAFGPFLGFFISWIFTCLGCFLSFYLFRSKIKKWFEHKFLKGKNKKKILKMMNIIDNMSLSSLAILVAIPFTPACLVNIAAGLSNMNQKKYMIAMLIGKLFMVYFWGYVGTTLIECFTHPIYLVKIFIMLLLAFAVSKIANRVLDID